MNHPNPSPASPPTPKLPAWFRALRPHQWSKNLLLFVAPAVSHRIFYPDVYPDVFKNALLGFVAFSLCASAVYIINDLLDREVDRLDDFKRHRPFASGALSTRAGALMAPLLLLLAIIPTYYINQDAFGFSLLAYFILTTLYSTWLKQKLMVDVLILAGLYTLRVLGGAYATDITASKWLLAFSVFFFFSLAMVKRFSELQRLQNQDGTQNARRGYHVGDINLLMCLGVTSSYISVLVLALYMDSPEAHELYQSANRADPAADPAAGTPITLWLICPLLLYWVSRLWIRAHRGKMHADPIVFTLRDPVSYVVGLLVLALVVLASAI